MLARTFTLGLLGLDVHPLIVEVDLAHGLPLFDVVGLPDASVRESRDRVRASLRNSGFTLPAGRVVVNLAPAHLRKVGPAYDLPIALGMLAAAGFVPPGSLKKAFFVGELALDGGVRAVRGSLCLATGTPSGTEWPTRLVMPAENADELSITQESDHVRLASHLREVVTWLQGGEDLATVRRRAASPEDVVLPDLADVRGQSSARRALEIAAAGGHHILLLGPPGIGKSMLATRLPGIIPPLTRQEALEVARVNSAAGRGSAAWTEQRPWRAPHHTITLRGFLGGGGPWPKPGELSLAHCGVLLLDEFPEFRQEILAALRQPLEDKMVTLVRGQASVTYPANVQLVATANPCPCGWEGDPLRVCTCGSGQIDRYRRRMNGPIMDRIDIIVQMSRAISTGVDNARAESSAAVKRRVLAAWQRRLTRAKLAGGEAKAHFLDTECRCYLQAAGEKTGLSTRAVERSIGVARTIADLAEREFITVDDLAEAVTYRNWLPDHS